VSRRNPGDRETDQRNQESGGERVFDVVGGHETLPVVRRKNGRAAVRIKFDRFENAKDSVKTAIAINRQPTKSDRRVGDSDAPPGATLSPN
jgi:hypothetical protein